MAKINVGPYFYQQNGFFYVATDNEVIYSYEQVPLKDFVDKNKGCDESLIHDVRILDSEHLLLERRSTISGNRKRKILPCGIYALHYDKYRNICLAPRNFTSDRFLDLHSQVIEEIELNIDNFIKLKSEYSRLQILHKRGYLLYGPPGNGKTMLINHIVEKYQNEAFVIYIENATDFYLVNQFKEAFKGFLTIFIIEELTTQSSSEYVNELLNFLDGPLSWDDCIIFATTNYPEALPDNIIDRPSRFDMVVLVDNPDEEMRRQYLQNVIGYSTEEILRKTKNHSLAYLKELCIKSLLNNQPLKESVKGLEGFRQYARNQKALKAEQYVR